MLRLVTGRKTAAALKHGPIGSVIIPAHNEEASIGLCLSSLLAGARPGEFEIIVVCNGCTDGTANAARAFGTMVRVIEIEVGSKIIALNLGNKAARYLSAPLSRCRSRTFDRFRPRASGRRQDPSCTAAIGAMETDVTQAPWLLRQYYAVWNRQAYLRNGKFGGAYALSEDGCRHVGILPPVINDDEYVRRRIPQDMVQVVEGCSFRAQMPRTLRDLIAVRTRVHRGNRQLLQLSRPPDPPCRPRPAAGHEEPAGHGTAPPRSLDRACGLCRGQCDGQVPGAGAGHQLGP